MSEFKMNASVSKIGYATVSLQISATIYLILGLIFIFFMPNLIAGSPALQEEIHSWIAPVFGGFFFSIAVLIQFLVRGLKRRRFWAWILGLCVFCVYLPSAFFPPAGFGFWGLLARTSRREFGVGRGGEVNSNLALTDS